MTTTNYQQQATDFLTATNTSFNAVFETFDYYFQDDKQKRNIFKITLSNDRHKYSFRFGSSLKDSLKNSNDVMYETDFDFYSGLKFESLKKEYLSYSDKIKISVAKEAYDANKIPSLIDKQKVKNIYTDFVKSNTNKYVKSLTILSLQDWTDKIIQSLVRRLVELAATNWGEGIPAKKIIAPTPYDVLASITKYEVGTFDDFCSNYGYDADSRKAYKTYKEVMKEWKNVELLFTPEQLELLQEIQ